VSLTPVIRLLRERAGLNPDAVSRATIPTAVAARMRALGLSDPAAYAARLADDAEEFPSLVDEVVIPETWFFRGGPLFAYLADHVKAALGSRPFRALSVPCSTGEEPYSLAVALREAGVPLAGTTILGVDLSRRCLDRARAGCYGDFSFRQTDPGLRRRHFRPAGDRWQIDPAVRDAVAFREGNLLDPLFLAGEAPFDLVLCRNLFIYLLPAARRQALETLERLLAPDGLLCVGPAEPLDLLAPQFRRVGPEECFVYRRGPGPASGSPVVGRVSNPSSKMDGLETRPTPRRAPAPAPVSRPPVPPPPAEEPLAEARRRADRGELAEALAACRAHLERAGPSAALYGLLGVIHQARREPDEAVRCFQSALYLDPDHAEALAHLMLLCQERGDGPRAALLRRRLERLAAGGEP
jgi:chemotaxis protein methyltransferase WspC